MKDKSNPSMEFDISDCRGIVIDDNISIGGAMSFKAVRTTGMVMRRNKSITDNQILDELRQQLSELKQKVAAIEEEGTRSQALDTIGNIERTVGSDRCSQHYQKLTDLLRDYVEVYSPLLSNLGVSLTNLGTALGL